MKRFFLLGLLFAAALFAAQPTTKVGGSATTKVGGSATTKVAALAPTGYTLLYDSVTSATNEFDLGDQDPHYYIGQSLFNDASSRTIGKITVKMRRSTGNTSGKTFTVTIWTLSGDALGTALATATVTGFNTGSATNVEFVFSSPYTTTGGSTYALTLDQGGASDGSNFVVVYYDDDANSPLPWPGTTELARWNLSKAANGEFPPYVMSMKLYTTP